MSFAMLLVNLPYRGETLSFRIGRQNVRIHGNMEKVEVLREVFPILAQGGAYDGEMLLTTPDIRSIAFQGQGRYALAHTTEPNAAHPLFWQWLENPAEADDGELLTLAGVSA